jgi:hypothetical protein
MDPGTEDLRIEAAAFFVPDPDEAVSLATFGAGVEIETDIALLTPKRTRVPGLIGADGMDQAGSVVGLLDGLHIESPRGVVGIREASRIRTGRSPQHSGH